MAVSFNTKMTLHHLLAQVSTSRAETLRNQQQLHIKPNGHEPTGTINRAQLAGILVALQQWNTDIASDSASCLSQTSKQTLNPMRMRTYLHAGLIQATS
eukprot:1156389-Pelagomonas_calceolata.AAC.7